MADAEATTVLDHIDGIVVPGKVFEEAANEYWALICLWDGMEFLYGHRQVRMNHLAKRKGEFI